MSFLKTGLENMTTIHLQSAMCNVTLYDDRQQKLLFSCWPYTESGRYWLVLDGAGSVKGGTGLYSFIVGRFVDICWEICRSLVAGAWTERQKMYHGGSFLKLADDNMDIQNPEAQNRELSGF